jgi:hypothetical protein
VVSLLNGHPGALKFSSGTHMLVSGLKETNRGVTSPGNHRSVLSIGMRIPHARR